MREEFGMTKDFLAKIGRMLCGMKPWHRGRARYKPPRPQLHSPGNCATVNGRIMKKFLAMHPAAAVGAALLFAGIFPAFGDMQIRNYVAARHDRFYSGSDKNFVGGSFDFSGLGRSSDGRWATLVSDNYFLSAYHYFPGTGSSVTFYAANDLTGPSYSYTVAGGERVGTTDLWVGWFDSVADAGLARYPVLDLAAESDYLGLELFNCGVSNRVGRNVSDSIVDATEGPSTEKTLWFDYDNSDSPSVGGDETYLWYGDSGAATFIPWGDSLTVAGIHWSITDGNPGAHEGESSIDTFVPAYIDGVNSILSARSQSVATVPEPATPAMILTAALCLFAARTLRSKRPGWLRAGR